MTADDYADALVTVADCGRGPLAELLVQLSQGAPINASQLTRCMEQMQVGGGPFPSGRGLGVWLARNSCLG